MIKVNLVGEGRKKAPRAAVVKVRPTNLTPVLLILIVLGSAGGGYWWHLGLVNASADLDTKISQAQAEKARLEAVIKADRIYEARKKALEARVNIVEGLQKSQVSPVLVLDELSNAVQRTNFVWLSTLEQKDAVVNMSGMGTSLGAIADFYTNLGATGYFKNIDLGTSQESGGNFTFSLKCEFSPPRSAPKPNSQVEAGGGN